MIPAMLMALVAFALAPAAEGDERRSGFEDMSQATQDMQRDDMANPGMFAVSEGGALWSEPANEGRAACAGCHGAPGAMAGVAVRYPSFDAATGRAVDLEGRINLCRTRHQNAEPFDREGRPLLGLAALVAHQSRGMPIRPSSDPGMQALRAEGEALWSRRIGQLNLSCATCHDENAGKRLGGSLIPEGHPTGYPIYRLEWQDVGSLQRRLRGCFTGVRAAPLEPGSREAVALEAYLMERAAGMKIETPAVRP